MVFVTGVRAPAFKERHLSWCGWDTHSLHPLFLAVVGFLMRLLVPPWCSDVSGLLLPSEKGKRGKFASGGLKGPDLRAPAESASLLLYAGSHRTQVVGIPSYGRQGSPCSHREAEKLVLLQTSLLHR